MDVAALIARIESRADYAGQIQHVEVLPERPGRFADPRQPLPAPLQKLLSRTRARSRLLISKNGRMTQTLL